MDDDYEDRGWDGGDMLDEEVTLLHCFQHCHNFCCSQSEGGEEIVENPAEVLKECAVKFSTSDYIMEPGIFSQLKR